MPATALLSGGSSSQRLAVFIGTDREEQRLPHLVRPDPVTAAAEAVDDDLGGKRAVEAANLQITGPVRNHVSQVLILRPVKHERGANLQGLGTLVIDCVGGVTRLE